VEDQSTLRLCPSYLGNGHRTIPTQRTVSRAERQLEGVQASFELASIPMMYIQTIIFILYWNFKYILLI